MSEVPDRTVGESSAPLYLQIAEWVEQRVRNGTFTPGERLPPVRALAQRLSVNRGSVALAYSHLARTGLLQTGLGKGTFVRSAPLPGPAPRGSPKSPDDFWQPYLTEINARLGAPRAAMLDSDPANPWVPENGSTSPTHTRLAMDLPLSDHRLSYPLVKEALHELATTLPRDSLAYGHPQGRISLRAQLAERARAAEMDVRASDILVCNGTQQALSLVSSVLIQPGDTVVMENPGYPGAARAFRMFGARIIGVPVDDDGLKVDLLEAILREYRPKLIYTVPTFQVPTGTTMPLERRIKLYRLAESNGIPIVEDEYANPLYYGDTPPPPAIKSLDRQGLVIFIGTFSKTVGAGLRIGWIAAHSAMLSRLVQVKEAQDIHTSLFSQMLLDNILQDGRYDAHVTSLRRHYGERYRTLVRELEAEMGPAISFHPSRGAFSIWVTLHGSATATSWLQFAKARGVQFHLGGSYFPEDDNDRHAQICFSQLTPGEIESAVAQLATALQEARASHERESRGGQPFLPFSS